MLSEIEASRAVKHPAARRRVRLAAQIVGETCMEFLENVAEVGIGVLNDERRIAESHQ